MSGNDVFKNGYELCLKNAELWLNEGNMLWERCSYGHACALYFHGLEGLVHAWYAWLVYIGAIEPDNKDFLDSLKYHDTKLRSFWGLFLSRQIDWEKITVESGFLEKEESWEKVEQELREFNDTISGLSRELMKMRNRSIYVNYSKEKTFESPLDIAKDDAAQLSIGIHSVYELIVYYIRGSDERTKSILRKVYRSMYS